MRVSQNPLPVSQNPLPVSQNPLPVFQHPLKYHNYTGPKIKINKRKEKIGKDLRKVKKDLRKNTVSWEEFVEKKSENNAVEIDSDSSVIDNSSTVIQIDSDSEIDDVILICEIPPPLPSPSPSPSSRSEKSLPLKKRNHLFVFEERGGGEEEEESLFVLKDLKIEEDNDFDEGEIIKNIEEDNELNVYLGDKFVQFVMEDKFEDGDYLKFLMDVSRSNSPQSVQSNSELDSVCEDVEFDMIVDHDRIMDMADSLHTDLNGINKIVEEIKLEIEQNVHIPSAMSRIASNSTSSQTLSNSEFDGNIFRIM